MTYCEAAVFVPYFLWNIYIQIFHTFLPKLFRRALIADSCDTKGCNINSDLASQKQSICSAPQTLQCADSASRSDATSLHGVLPQELLDSMNERVGKSSSAHPIQARREPYIYMEGVGANCKINDGVSFEFSMDIKPKVKCLQVGCVLEVLLFYYPYAVLMPYCHLLISLNVHFLLFVPF